MPQFNPRDVHFPKDGEMVIELNHPYVTGKNELQVFLNGILAVVDHDYIETDPTHITFNFQLSKEDVVVTQHLVYFDDKFVRVISDRAKALFTRYGAESRLINNQVYKITFTYADKEFESKFTTPITPMYASVNSIRSDLGRFVEKISDFQIAFMIYENSILASTMFTDYFEINEDTGLGTLTTTNGVIPFKVQQFVRYQTEYNLLSQIILTMIGQASTDSFVLGTLEVNKGYQIGDYKPLLNAAKAQASKFARGTKMFASAVKGGTSSYPLNTPRRDMGSVFTST